MKFKRVRGLQASTVSEKKAALFYWPADPNPYQTLLYGEPQTRFAISSGGVVRAIMSSLLNGNQKVFFHVHWLYKIFRPRFEFLNLVRAVLFLFGVRVLVFLGGHIFWTLHNLYEHETPSTIDERRFRRKLTPLVTAIFHTRAAKEIAEEAYGLEFSNAIIAAHGAYSFPPPQPLQDRSDSVTTFMHLGRLREYKGLAPFLRTFSALADDGYPIRAKVIGYSKSALVPLGLLEMAGPGIEIENRFVPEGELRQVLSDADFYFVPSERFLTPGSAVLAASLGIPLLITKNRVTEEMFGDNRGVLFFTPESLRETLLSAARISPQEQFEMSRSLLQLSDTWKWAEMMDAMGQYSKFTTVEE